MTLSSIIFVFGFFPIFLLLYYISKTEYKDFILLVSSLYFYYITDAHRTIYVVILCIGIYFLTWAMEKKKHRRVRQIYAAIGIIATVAVWLYYRYSNYVIYAAKTILGSKDTLQSISARVPLLGISFLCFSIISYISDCYTGKIQYQKSLVKFMTYILMFPKIIMGPIERYSNIEKNLNRPDISMENAGIGIKRFIYGFCKKSNNRR